MLLQITDECNGLVIHYHNNIWLLWRIPAALPSQGLPLEKPIGRTIKLNVWVEWPIRAALCSPTRQVWASPVHRDSTPIPQLALGKTYWWNGLFLQHYAAPANASPVHRNRTPVPGLAVGVGGAEHLGRGHILRRHKGGERGAPRAPQHRILHLRQRAGAGAQNHKLQLKMYCCKSSDP